MLFRSPITLRWEDVFTAEEVDDEMVSDLEQIFMRQGFETYAAVAVDGALGGFATNAAEHAERELLSSGIWDGAISHAHEIATKEKREVRVFLLINRAPCHRFCTPTLVNEIGRRKSDQNSGKLSPRVKFILAPTGVYEPTNQKQRRALALEIAQELAKKKKIALKIGRASCRERV